MKGVLGIHCIFSYFVVSDLGSMINNSLYTTYKSAIIGQSGGEIALVGGVKLTIPPHALSEKVEVIIGVSFDPKHLPQVGFIQLFSVSICFL